MGSMSCGGNVSFVVADVDNARESLLFIDTVSLRCEDGLPVAFHGALSRCITWEGHLDDAASADMPTPTSVSWLLQSWYRLR